MRYFTFNGIDSRTLFPITNAIHRPYLPPINVPSFNIPNRAGAVSIQRNDIGTREITVEVTFLMNSHEEVRQRVRDMAAFLLYSEDKPLIFSDEPNLLYYARFNQDNTDLEEIAFMGRGELNFTCFDPYAYELEETTVTMPDLASETNVVNNGSTFVYPRFRIAPTLNSTYLKITNVTTDEFMYYNALVAAGSALIIDHASNQVYDEGTKENLVRNITLDSQFFSLVTGTNTILIQNQNPDGSGINQGSLQMFWRERFF